MHNFVEVGVNTDISGKNLDLTNKLLFYKRKSRNTGILTSLDSQRELVFTALFPLSPQSYPQAGAFRPDV